MPPIRYAKIKLIIAYQDFMLSRIPLATYSIVLEHLYYLTCILESSIEKVIAVKQINKATQNLP